MKFPKHVNLTLEHNPHTVCYETVEGHFAHTQEPNNELYDFTSDGDKEKCIEQNDFWTAHWYPDTPVGFVCVAAPSLERLLEYLAKIEE